MQRTRVAAAISTALASGLVGAVTMVGAGSASATPARSENPVLNYCVNTHKAPCWASTQRTPVYLYPHSGSGRTNIGITVVELTCWYYGTPVVHDDNIEDHIESYLNSAGHYVSANGHVPDWNVNLDNHNPSAVGVPHCR